MGRGTAPPILLVRKVADRQIVEARCERAAAAGVTIGMTLAHARALLLPAPCRSGPPDPTRQRGIRNEGKKQANIEHRTSNVEHRTEERSTSMLGVRCSAFDVPFHVLPFQPDRDNAALRALAAWAVRFAPLVAPDPPDGLLIDITGCQRLHGGERRLINAIANNLEWLGFRARIACASTFACAWAAARFSEQDRAIVSGGDERIAMHSLPVESLRIDESVVESLHEIGIATIGELLRIPRLQLAARYGDDLLLRIDQVFGEAIETIEPVRPVPLLEAQRAFDGPVKQIEAIELASRDLLEKLIDLLYQNESGLTRLNVTFERIDAPDVRDSIRLAHPSRDFRHLWSLIKPKVEHLHLGFGVERILFSAAGTRPVGHTQQHVRTEDTVNGNRVSVDRAIGELTDHFIAHLGPDRISHMRTRESHVPERAVECVEVDVEHGHGCHGFAAQQQAVRVKEERPTTRLALRAKPWHQTEPAGRVRQTRPVHRTGHISGRVCGPDLLSAPSPHLPSGLSLRVEDRVSAFRIEHFDSPIALIRPSRLFPRPLPIEVVSLSPEGPLLSIRMRGELQEVIDTIGPERIADEWWLRSRIDFQNLSRDYYKAQIVSGRWLWLFRESIARRWFLHGEWM